jgi:hypothetical protein
MAFNGNSGSSLDNNHPSMGKSDLAHQQLLNFTQQLDDKSALILNFQQTIFKAVFEIWKNLTQAQINLAIDLFQLVMEQSLSARERLGIITEYQLKRLQEITISEQSLTLEAAEIFQAQTEAVREQVSGIWRPGLNISRD